MRKLVELYIELWYQFYECIDASFGIEEFIQHHYFFLFKNAIAALERPSFVANGVFRFTEYILQLIQAILRVLPVDGQCLWSMARVGLTKQM